MAQRNRHVVGIVGTMGSGKGAATKKFIEHAFQEYQITTPIKKAAHELVRCPHKALWGPSENRTDKVRTVLQQLGDIARQYDPMTLIKQMVLEVEFLHKSLGKSVVISDVRLQKEMEVIKGVLGGYIIKMERPGSKKDGHVTEMESELATGPWVDYAISNSGDLYDLEHMIQEIISRELPRS